MFHAGPLISEAALLTSGVNGSVNKLGGSGVAYRLGLLPRSLVSPSPKTDGR